MGNGDLSAAASFADRAHGRAHRPGGPHHHARVMVQVHGSVGPVIQTPTAHDMAAM